MEICRSPDGWSLQHHGLTNSLGQHPIQEFSEGHLGGQAGCFSPRNDKVESDSFCQGRRFCPSCLDLLLILIWSNLCGKAPKISKKQVEKLILSDGLSTAISVHLLPVTWSQDYIMAVGFASLVCKISMESSF